MSPSVSTMYLHLLMSLSWALFISLSHYTINAELVASVVLPHGDFALAPELLPVGSKARNAADKVAIAARQAGAWLMSTSIQPDLILLSTPHGIELSHDFSFYLGSFASGYVNIGQDLHNSTNTSSYRLYLERISLAPTMTKSLLEELSGQAVNGILSYADSEDVALRWGEVVPLLLVLGNKTTPMNFQREHRYMILSHPLRRYTEAPSMVPELLELGKSIRIWADSRPERIALLVSSDLSHTHRSDGPYGYSNASALFDDAVGQWVKNPVANEASLLTKAASIQNEAMACGFTGLVMLHGAIRDGSFKSNLLANFNATYYGMMVATFMRKEYLPEIVARRH